MNEDARSENTPTGQALGSVAVLAASTLAIAGGGFAATKLVGKGVKTAGKAASKVDDYLVKREAEVQHEMDLARKAGGDISRSDAVAIKRRKKKEAKLDARQEKVRNKKREMFGSEYDPTEEEFLESFNENFRANDSTVNRIGNTASPGKPDPHDPGPSFEKSTAGKFKRPGTSKPFERETRTGVSSAVPNGVIQ